MSTFTIRAARPEDAVAMHAALRGIAEAVDGLHKITSTPQDIERDGFGPHARFHTLIAESDSKFAGMCLYFPIYSTWMGKSGAYVQDLFIAREFRGQGIGEGLLRRLAHDLRRAGGAYIELAVDAGNHAAQRFYERIGIPYRADDRIHRIAGDAFFAFAGRDDTKE